MTPRPVSTSPDRPPTLASRQFDPASIEAEQRIRRAYDLMAVCAVCPRMCGAQRLAGEIGTCRSGKEPTVASWNLHQGEEPPISGTRGSGTIFLSGCSLRCIYCQNYPISQMGVGRGVTVVDLVGMIMELSAAGAHNINFVTPTHQTPFLLEAVIRARRQGFRLPIVWNTSGYERVETLKLLDGVVDIYLADMRYADSTAAARFSKAKDYPDVNRRAIIEMHRQVGTLVLDDQGIAVRGLLVRHLVLPDNMAGSRQTFEFLAQAVSPATAVSVMSQYFPTYHAVDDPHLGRRLHRREYDAAIAAFDESGLTHGYRQDL